MLLSQCLVSYGHITDKLQNHVHTIFHAVLHRHYSMAVRVHFPADVFNVLTSLLFSKHTLDLVVVLKMGFLKANLVQDTCQVPLPL